MTTSRNGRRASLVIVTLAFSLAACGSSVDGSNGTGAAGGTGAGGGATTGGAGTTGDAGTTGSGGSRGGGGAGTAGTGVPGRGGANGTAGATGGTAAGGAGGPTGAAGTTGGAGMSGSAGSMGAAGRGGATGAAGRGGAAGGGAGAGGSAGTGGGAAGAGQCPATATAIAGETTQTIMVGGMNRTFIRHIPTGYTGKTPVPVVIDFHPLGGSGSGQKNLSGWAALGDSKGFITIFPNGVGNSWNVGRCCNPAQMQNIDDVAFTKAIITALAKDACIDTKRVYASGCSNGGGMAYKVACSAADVIAAVAPVDFDCTTNTSTDMTEQLNNSCAMCNPARPISETQFRGTNDSAVPYNGGLTQVVSGFYFPGAMKNFTTWGQLNMCTGTPQALPGHSACQAYPTCGGNVDTVLCTVQNGSHCGSYSSFGIINIAWEMFQKEALP